MDHSILEKFRLCEKLLHLKSFSNPFSVNVLSRVAFKLTTFSIFAFMDKLKTVAFHTLGCKLNFSETATLAREILNKGYIQKDFSDQADLYVINTCSVTENADRECKQIVRRVKRLSPESRIIITGCYAQLKAPEIAAIPGVDLVLGSNEKFRLTEYLADLGEATGIYHCSDIRDVHRFDSAYSMHERTRTFLKIQDGCDYKCSYCTIPKARGLSRSDNINNIIKEASKIAEEGIKEIVLTGVNIGDFGRDEYGNKTGETLLDLLKQLDKVEGIERYRISSIEPNLLTEEIIDFVSESNKIMPHFHIPLQSGSNKILALMRRRYKRSRYTDRVDYIRKQMPLASIGVDVIVGFPGETKQDFQDTYDYLRDLDISYLHVFTYSERPNTPAITMSEVVPMQERHNRNQALRNLSRLKLHAFIEKQDGTSRTVLFEHQNNHGMMEGYTDNYIRIAVPYNPSWSNTLRNIQINSQELIKL